MTHIAGGNHKLQDHLPTHAVIVLIFIIIMQRKNK